MRSSARGVSFGGSSRMGSQPTGGEPGGEMRKLRSTVGGRRWKGENFFVPFGVEVEEDAMGVGSARYTRNVVLELVKNQKRSSTSAVEELTGRPNPPGLSHR